MYLQMIKDRLTEMCVLFLFSKFLCSPTKIQILLVAQFILSIYNYACLQIIKAT